MWISWILSIWWIFQTLWYLWVIGIFFIVQKFVKTQNSEFDFYSSRNFTNFAVLLFLMIFPRVFFIEVDFCIIEFPGPRPTKRTTTASKATGKSHLRMWRIEPRINQPQRQGRLWRKRPPQTKILITWTTRYSTRKERFEGQSQWLGRRTGGIQAAASNLILVRSSLNFLVWQENFNAEPRFRKQQSVEYSMRCGLCLAFNIVECNLLRFNKSEQSELRLFLRQKQH